MNEASMQLLELLKNDWPHDLKEVRELLKRGADVNAVDDDGNTPLLLELRLSFCSADMLEFLSKKGANLQHRNHRRQTALMLALLRWQDDFSVDLIKGGADIGATDTEGNSVVHYAYGNKKILGVLVKAGASLSQTNKKNQSLLHVPVTPDGGIDTATLKWLLKQGLDPNAKDVDGHTSLHAVSRIKSDDPQKAAQTLIESGADPAVLDATGTPLSVFHLHYGDQNLTKWFAEKGSHPFDAIIAGDLERVTEQFIPGLVIPHLRWGLTPLHVAALIGASQEIVAHLVKATSDLNVTDEHGNSALALAICNKRPEIALALIKAGASSAKLGTVGFTDSVKDLVLMANFELLSAMIEGKQPDELSQLYGPYTRHFKASQNSLNCLRLIIDKGISPSAVDVDGMVFANYIEDWQFRLNDSIAVLLDQLTKLVEKGADPQLKPKTQECVAYLLKNKKYEIPNAAERLLIQCLERGMSCKWSQGDSLLHHAIEKKNSHLVEVILATGEEHIYPACMRNTKTPLRIAVEAQYQTGVGLLLSAGNMVINEQILDEAIQQCRSEKIMAMLLDYKSQSSGSSASQDSAMLMKTAKDAAERGMNDILESLVEKGVQREYVIQLRAEVAAKNGKTDVLKELFDEGLSLNKQIDGVPLFHTLIMHSNSVNTIQWAKNNGADLTLTDSSGKTLLHKGVMDWQFNLQSLKELLDGKRSTLPHRSAGWP
jgi:ankyrin repeat protein